MNILVMTKLGPKNVNGKALSIMSVFYLIPSLSGSSAQTVAVFQTGTKSQKSSKGLGGQLFIVLLFICLLLSRYLFHCKKYSQGAV